MWKGGLCIYGTLRVSNNFSVDKTGREGFCRMDWTVHNNKLTVNKIFPLDLSLKFKLTFLLGKFLISD